MPKPAQTIDVPAEAIPQDEPQTMALAKPQSGAVGKALEPSQIQAPKVTAEQAKIEAIADLTKAAYARAATLELTDEEIEKLSAPFPDDAFKPGAAGKENLIYIEHAFLRERLNQVFKPGRWAIVPRSRWAEDFMTKGYPANPQRHLPAKPPQKAARVYVEAMLVIRGCFVSEAIGEMEYYPDNAAQNYGDAVEGAKTAALRRCCKELGVGLQAWQKDWCEGWWARRNAARAAGNAPGRSNPPSRHTPPAQSAGNVAKRETAPANSQGATPQTGAATPQKSLFAGPKTREWAVKKLADMRDLAEEYFRKLENPAVLMPNETLENLPFRFVPISHEQLKLLREKITDFGNGATVEHAYPPNPEPPGEAPAKTKQGKPAQTTQAPPAQTGEQKPPPNVERAKAEDPEWWRDVIVPIPPKGMKRDEYLKNPQTVGQLYDGRHDQDIAKRLFGFIGHFTVETTWVNSEGQTRNRNANQIEQDKVFREALDACAEYVQKHGKDTEAGSEPQPEAEEQTPFD